MKPMVAVADVEDNSLIELYLQDLGEFHRKNLSHRKFVLTITIVIKHYSASRTNSEGRYLMESIAEYIIVESFVIVVVYISSTCKLDSFEVMESIMACMAISPKQSTKVLC
jgi:hypothetical protein